MDFMTKIRFCLKSADDIEREWVTIRSTKIELESERKNLESKKKELEYQKRKYEEDFQKRIIQLDIQKKEIEELNQKIIEEKKAFEPAWEDIRNENFKIFNERKSISNTWKAINEEWQKLLEFHPELKQEIADKNIAAIMSQKHTDESFTGLDPEVIDKMHQKETKITSGGEDTIRYVRTDHHNLHGHKE